MAEGEVVEVGVGVEQRGEVGAGSGMWCGDCEVSADNGNDRGEGQEKTNVPVEGTLGGRGAGAVEC